MKSLNITHLYPDLLNLYGDKGNINSLKMRLLWRGMAGEVKNILSSDDFDLSKTDILLLGGGSDKEQKEVLEILKKNKDKLKSYIENGGVFLALCGRYQMLGKSLILDGKKEEGLFLIDFYSTEEKKRLMGNVLIETQIDGKKEEIIGFENHSSRTFLGENVKPFGKVLNGNGNSEDGFEGVWYKNVIGTYLHGPLLPKNPDLTDYRISLALKKKYDDFKGLEKLDDYMEDMARRKVMERKFI